MLSLKKTRERKSAPTKKRSVPITTESGLSGRSAIQASRGIKASGIWSSPVNLLLADIPSLRFTKLENRSPIIAPTATTKPTSHPRPISGATIVVSATERATPLMVLDEPKSGFPSERIALPSSGCALSFPKSFAAITGVPFATARRVSS